MTKPIEVKIMKNQEKGKNLTKPIEAKSKKCLTGLQNDSYLFTIINESTNRSCLARGCYPNFKMPLLQNELKLIEEWWGGI